MLYTEGQAEDGLRLYKDGHEMLRRLFEKAWASNDVHLILRAEHAFVLSDLENSKSEEKEGRQSAKAALQDIEDALAALSTVRNPTLYAAVDKAFPHIGETWRFKGLPNDAFQSFCKGHKARLQNGIKRLGVPEIDLAIVRLRMDALDKIRDIYCDLQRQVLK
jgi:hypothetical protein